MLAQVSSKARTIFEKISNPVMSTLEAFIIFLKHGTLHSIKLPSPERDGFMSTQIRLGNWASRWSSASLGSGTAGALVWRRGARCTGGGFTARAKRVSLELLHGFLQMMHAQMIGTCIRSIFGMEPIHAIHEIGMRT